MQENIDPIIDNKSSEEKTFNNPVEKIKNDKTNLIKNDQEENLMNSNNQNIKKIETNEINNKKNGSPSANDTKTKLKKEIPIEKKPFKEFINNHLLPSLINEFKQRGFEINEINLENTFRPIAGDKCWVIYCEIKTICKFWLSFEKDDISSLKSISLCTSNQEPSVIESFLIDEKRITLQLIISRILQRLNGQKLIGIN